MLPASAHLVQVRAMTVADLPFVAQLHRSYLAHGLFPALGPRFLRAYLHTYAASPFGLAYVALFDGSPVGYLVGTVDQRAHANHVLRLHGLRLGVLGLVALSVRPRVAWRFSRTRARRYIAVGARLVRSGTGASPSSGSAGGVAVLSHVAVSASARGAGVGGALVERFTQDARSSGATAARLLTKADDGGASGFYERLGWDPSGVVTDRDGIMWSRFGLQLS